MKLLYTALFYLILPLVFARLYWRGIKAPAYRHRWKERLGYYQIPVLNNSVWIHAVSVGEAEAVFPLIKRLQALYPAQAFVVTTTTPTGSARVQAVLGKTVAHVYLPYDTLGAVQRFFKHFQPKIAVIMETEIWPNLFAACGQRDIPLLIINARLSAKSARGYRRITGLVRPTLSHVTTIATQTDADAGRFLAIGASPQQVQTLGNIKFDTPPAGALLIQGQQLRKQAFPGRFVWIVASTHHNEELFFLSLYPKLKAIAPSLLLLIVPRHPERFIDVQQLCQTQSLNVVMRSSGLDCDNSTDVYIADTLGELKMLYAAADIAFVGGSLVPVGGHNVLEAAAVNVPVMFGTYMHNFSLIAQGLLDANAALQCPDSPALLNGFERLYSDTAYRRTLTKNAQQFIFDNRGATERILDLLNHAMP